MKIYIDAGHGESIRGAYDPGAVGLHGTKENDVTVDLARRLGHLLREKGYQTLGAALAAGPDRENFREAVQAANAARAAFFVSLHCNAAAARSANGYEVLYRSGGNAAKAVLDEITRQVVRGDSRWLEEPLRLTNRGTKKRTDLAVLNGTRMPAILVEVAFISNEREEDLLNEPTVLQAFAQAIADGIDAFLQG